MNGLGPGQCVVKAWKERPLELQEKITVPENGEGKRSRAFLKG
jgi:hypothetical protein